ncbi:OmpA family protein [Pedobacter cryotolerans]|uniref:Flagellar motor protein MotB n=1 Tax=Pedobacter cryotolerans TaxID=2571270 RepID=A0A4U1BZY9_9SPHI|nr:OmpA family protein [Pedobacter cryotolerans]TKB98155.1 flagellar motor protein MotB [Pedobacter cryotolerans]
MRRIFNISIIVISILMLNISTSKAQYVLKEADIQFDLYNYEKAVILYTEAYQKKKTLKATERLAESYRLMQDYKQAESWYALLISTEGAKPEAHRWHAEMLKNNSKYSEAKVQYAKYATQAKNLTPAQFNQVDVWQKSCDSAVKWMRNPNTIAIKNEKSLNSAQSDWAAVNYNGNVVFTSDRSNIGELNVRTDKPFLKFDTGKKPDKKIYGWTGNEYLKIYQKDKSIDSISLFPINAHTDYHVGATSFSKNGNEVFFTLTKIPSKVEKLKNAPSTINIEIYSSKMENGKWSEPIPFRYNKAQEWSVGDPYLSIDGTTLFFVSNKPGGLGGTDIYYCKRSSGGNWGEAIALSAANTAGNERSPMKDDENFYFSTDGSISMGGLDIFKAKITDRGVLTNIENMGYPLNSAQDDFAFNILDKTKGYFASNREGGIGSDDIYTFIEQLKLKFRLEGQVFNKETNFPLANAVVTLKHVNGTPIKTTTDENGRYKFNLEENTDYNVLAEKTEFRTANEDITTKGLNESKVIKQDLYLAQIVIGKEIRIENIYYDFDKSNIRPDASKELDKIVTVMKENPTIWIVLGSHTDSRGKDQYNQWLSQSRANSAVQYIIDRGVDKSRITAKGYGENKHVNECENGVKCSEEAHQLNRRTEFTIVKQ